MEVTGSYGPASDLFPWRYRRAGPLLEEWMTKADLVEQVADAIGPGITKKDCALVVDGFLNAVKLALAEGENIEIRGFGTFKVRSRKSRMARNPRTGDPVEVPSRSVPVFKPSKHLRARVAGLDRVFPY
jgi:integration host factor subunit beta